MEGQYWSMAAGMSDHHLLLVLACTTPGSSGGEIGAEMGACNCVLLYSMYAEGGTNSDRTSMRRFLLKRECARTSSASTMSTNCCMSTNLGAHRNAHQLSGSRHEVIRRRESALHARLLTVYAAAYRRTSAPHDVECATL